MDVDLPVPPSEPWAHAAAQSASYQSPNTLRARRTKPAKPQVLSSILDSLDTVAPLPSVDAFTDGAGRLSRPNSSSKSIASSHSLNHNISSPSFGVEYGRTLDLDDEEGMSDAALPPIVPTSRTPSGLSNRPSRRLSWSKAAPKAFFSSVRSTSRRSSLSATSVTERPSSAKHKLSSESWVRQDNDQAEHDDWASVTRGRTTHRSIRRIISQDMPRPAQLGSSPHRPAPSESTSLAEQIIARHPPRKYSHKGRLYLGDATITEDSQREDLSPSPIPVLRHTAASIHSSPSPNPELSSKINDVKAPSEQWIGLKEPNPHLPSIISDSIPTRTSSLRHSSNSPAGTKKKGKKSKRNSGLSTSSSKMKPRKSSPILDSSWADLDEDDETVKRIKQLREQRKSRLQESGPEFDFLDVKTAQIESNRMRGQLHELAAGTVYSDADRRPSPNRSVTDPVQLQQHATWTLETDEDEQVYGSFAAPPPNIGFQRKSADAKRSHSAQRRPTTSKSDLSAVHTPSSGFSNADALEKLQGRSPSAKGRPSRESTEKRRTSLRLKGFIVPEEPTTALPQHKLSKKSKRASRDRNTIYHPDVPLDFEKRKSRRKSMSDAKAARAIEEEIQIARNASIDYAVMSYLSAPRLSQTVQNPTTGRTIAFSEVGDPSGAAVFVCVGMGLTRYITAFYDELATTLRLRLITLDRPGVGASDPYPSMNKSGPLNWPDDVLAVSQHLGIAQFSILAHSAGAIYALATALILPHLVKGKVHLLAPWVPPSQLDAISHPTASTLPSNPLPRSQRFLRVLPTPLLKVANSSFMTATSASLQPATKRTAARCTTARTAQRRDAGPTEAPARPMSQDRPEYNRRESMMLMDQFMPTTHPLDNYPLPVRPLNATSKEGAVGNTLALSATATPGDPGFTYATTGLNAAEHTERERQTEYTSRLTQQTWDLATRDSNPATDLVVCLERNRDVGFRYTDVTREIVITHGSEDKRVPIANVKWLAEQMNRRSMATDLPESRDSNSDSAMMRGGGCEVRVLEGEGHGLMADPKIMGDVLTEIASYWLAQAKVRRR